jgi:membrane protein YdbS with pleckstrin-like domain
MSMLNADWKRPSPRLRTARHVQALVPAVVLAIGLGVILAFASYTAAALAAAAALLAGAVVDVLFQRRVGAWGYLEREDDLLIRRGLLVRRLSVVPYGRMQFIDVTAGPVERSLGLATVRLHTAAAATDARIPGLAADEAARLRDRLAELGEANAAGL